MQEEIIQQSNFTKLNCSQQLNDIKSTPQQKTLKQQTPQGNPTSKITFKVRNRRYMKLLDLRNNGFFSQQAIKLRHPLLYFLYVGQYDFTEASPQNNQNKTYVFSHFLEKNLLNLEYRNLLSEQMTSDLEKLMEKQKNLNEEQIQQLRKIFGAGKSKTHEAQIQNIQREMPPMEQNQMELEGQSETKTQIEKIEQLSRQLRDHIPSQAQITTLRQSIQYPQISSNSSHQPPSSLPLLNPSVTQSLYQKFSASSHRLTAQQKDLQQQSLIQHCQQLFLQGKLSNLQQINYDSIDQNDQYDDIKQENQDMEDRYFDEIQQKQQGDGGYYTGIQDY